MTWSTGGYPPGCTQRMLDEAAGGYDEEPPPCPICGDPECPPDFHEPHQKTLGDLIRQAGLAIYGSTRWQSVLAADLGINRRTIRRWTSGEDTPRPGVWRDLLALAQQRQREIIDLIKALEEIRP